MKSLIGHVLNSSCSIITAKTSLQSIANLLITEATHMGPRYTERSYLDLDLGPKFRPGNTKGSYLDLDLEVNNFVL